MKLKRIVIDIDELMYNDTIRVCVDFNIDPLGALTIEAAEILNSNWDVLESDSFAFRQRLDKVISDYNENAFQSYAQASQIREEYLSHY